MTTSLPPHLSRVLDRLEGVKKVGENQWRARSPLREDTTPSMYVRLAADGRVLIHDHGNPDSRAVLEAIGLTFADLFPPKATRMAKAPRKRTLVYTYTDEQRTPLYRVVRVESPTQGKRIRQQRRAGKQWVNGLKDDRGRQVRLVPYALPDLCDGTRRGEPIWVVEGEKKAEELRYFHLLATCNPMGAGKWDRLDPATLGVFNGRTVYVLPDNDDAGREHARSVARSMLKAGADSVRVVDIPGLSEGEDVYDWLQTPKGHVSTLARMAEATPPVTASDVEAGKARTASSGAGRLDVVCMADVKRRPLEWLWEGRVPIGKLTILAGHPGVNKSFVTCYMAAQVSTGRPWPNETEPQRVGTVIVLNAEDDPSDTIGPRLDAHDADSRKVAFVRATIVAKKDGSHERGVSLVHDRDELDRLLTSHPDCRLVIIDPINAYLGSEMDSYSDTDMRSVLNPLGKLAEKHRVAMVAVTHFSKGNSNASKDPLQRVIGSIAYVGAARSVLAIVRDRKDDHRRLMLPIKNNVGPDRGNGLAFRLDLSSGSSSLPRIAWDPGVLDESIYDIFDRGDDKESSTQQENAVVALAEVLATGPRWSQEVWKLMAERGLSKRTVQRAIARSEGRVESVLHGLGKGQRWFMRLDEHGDRTPE